MVYIFIVIGCIIGILGIFLIFSYVMHNKIFKNRYEADPNITYYTAEEFNLNVEKIEIIYKKDILRGAFYSYSNCIENKIIVFAHGMWSSTRAYMQDIEYLCRYGYKVLGFDYYGTDCSTGKSIVGLSKGLASLDVALTYIKNNPELCNKDVYVVGHSWGAYNTTNIIRYHKEVKKIVALAPFISISNLLKGMLSKVMWIFIPFIRFIEFLKCGKYAYTNSISSLNDYKGQALIYHSKDDPMVSFKYNTQVLMKKCKNKNLYFKILDNKQHNPNYSLEAIKGLTIYAQEIKTKTKEDAIVYKKNTNFHKLGELDEEIMKEIVSFLN